MSIDGQKTQQLRVLDVWLIGPLMIVGGLCLGRATGALLQIFGVGTILYNGMNHYQQSQTDKREGDSV